MNHLRGKFRPHIAVWLISFHSIAAYAVWRMFTTGYSGPAWVMLAVIWILAGEGISVAYHRYLTHRSFRCKAAFERIHYALASLAFQGTGQAWAENHTQHHAFADAPGDPHRPSEFGSGFLRTILGWFWSHMLWICFLPVRPPNYVSPTRFREDTSLRWQKRYYGIFAASGLVIPYLAAGWDGLLLAGFFRIVAEWHVIWSVNSLCHMIGSHATDAAGNRLESRNARNFPLHCLYGTLGLLSFGEFWHAEHHTEQGSARLGKKWYQLDPGWYSVLLAEKLGLVWNVQRPKVGTTA